MLGPILALIGWTFVMWVWLYATRIPAMQKANTTWAIAGGGDGINVGLAWDVASRVVHSLVQATKNDLMIRFAVFAIGSLVLFVLLLQTAWLLR